MTAFALDTSGAVEWPDGEVVRWDRLTPFTQGYVEALFKSAPYGDGRFMFPLGTVLTCGFHHLAPETLARIMADCEKAQQLSETIRPADGAAFWRLRDIQDYYRSFPPITTYLGDDGRVYLRDAELIQTVTL